MWLAYILPALIGLPMILYILIGFYIGREFHKGTRPFLKGAGYFAVIWVLLDVVPSAVLYTEVYCNDGTTVGAGDNMYCEASRGTVHIIQCMYYWMMTAIIDLHQAIVLGAGPRERDIRSKYCMAYSCTGYAYLESCQSSERYSLTRYYFRWGERYRLSQFDMEQKPRLFYMLASLALLL